MPIPNDVLMMVVFIVGVLCGYAMCIIKRMWRDYFDELEMRKIVRREGELKP